MAKLNFVDTISEKTVILDHEPFADKDELFRFISAQFKADGRILSEEEFLEALYQRENTGSTYMDNLIALPHGKSSTVQKNTICFCRLKEPMQYHSFDEEGPVRLVFLLGIQGGTESNEYLRILAALSGLLVYEEFVSALDTAGSYQEVFDIFKKFLGD